MLTSEHDKIVQGRRDMGRKGGLKKGGDTLTDLIQKLVQPDTTLEGLLAMLKAEESVSRSEDDSLFVEIEEEKIHYFPDALATGARAPRRQKSISMKALAIRLSRAKKNKFPQ
jgi:hypothetical protein